MQNTSLPSSFSFSIHANNCAGYYVDEQETKSAWFHSAKRPRLKIECLAAQNRLRKENHHDQHINVNVPTNCR
ncbi:hypothetical protein FC18_GL001582 [Lacticaseibacillus sharpeae JCM 1186 = DSM 20505]|uniref:Uncharacterized protein n=1 Tax=Lacticaseibacillus sharpeae JCM 1186 = DSM 20505 TaxID=1291052 RepID=A0A0R1ZJI6_9LACO|nr:hypothetical protein FC18_GL001582 [Lacticaseibacillus sharpeae JCM 1186 = DSM 20505]